MTHRSATLEGFRVLLRRPSLTLSEIAWRWSFWAAGGFLFAALLVEYLDTLVVGRRDLLFLDTGHPLLVGRALAHVFAGTGTRLVVAATIVVAGLGLAWTVLSAIGRSASLRAIREYFAVQAEDGESPHGGRQIRALTGLNLLRLAAGLATLIACVGALIIPGRALLQLQLHPIILFVISLGWFCLVWLAWTLLNWLFSLSAVFVVRDEADAFAAIASAAQFSREHGAGLWVISFWFGLAHLVLFFVGTTIASTILGMAAFVPLALVVIALFFVAIVYFVLVDSIHVGRVAAWFFLASAPAIGLAEGAAGMAGGGGGALATSIDSLNVSEFPPEDDIMSDVESRAESDIPRRADPLV